jgi:DNA-binding MarR family transcriptional regulator
VTNHVDVLNRILQLALFLNDDMERDLAGYGLTISRTRVLWELHVRGPVTQRELAQAIDVSARNVTGLVDALAETGFVTREPHPSDRRAALVTLTAHGKRTTDDLARRQRELARDLFERMPPERFDAFAAGLAEVLERLDALQQQ